MRRINFDSLRKCDDLYNYQSNVFEFENGIVDEVGSFYPMPIKARDLIMQGHYSKPIDSNTPDKLTKFNYQSYFEGVKSGYNELLPKDNATILELAVTNITLKYTEVDRVCSNSNAYDFGVAVGRLYHAWIYIADNVDEFKKLWEVLLIDFENENKTFSDCLNVDDKVVLLKKLHVLIDGFKGKRIAHVLMVLIDRKKIDFRFQNKIYDLMRLEFTFKTSDESISKYLKYDFAKKDEKEYIFVENALKS